MEIRLEKSTLRPWRVTDAAALVRHANDREVWRNMREGVQRRAVFKDGEFTDVVLYARLRPEP
jgi:RimJ/RimL family protein N-acetyltransferase